MLSHKVCNNTIYTHINTGLHSSRFRVVSPIGTRKVARQGQAFTESPKTGILAAMVKIGGDGPAAMLLAFGHEHQRFRRFRRHGLPLGLGWD